MGIVKAPRKFRAKSRKIADIPNSRSSHSTPVFSESDQELAARGHEYDDEDIQATINARLPQHGFTSKESLEEAFSDEDFCNAAILDARLNMSRDDLGINLCRKYLGEIGMYAMTWQNHAWDKPRYLPKVFVDFIVKAWRQRRTKAEQDTITADEKVFRKQMSQHINNQRARLRPKLVPFMIQFYPHLVNLLAETHVETPTHQEYKDAKAKLLETKDETSIDFFEPYPPRMRPIGDEKLIMDFIKISKLKKDQCKEAEDKLIASLSAEDKELRQERISAKWSEGSREVRQANKKEKEDKLTQQLNSQLGLSKSKEKRHGHKSDQKSKEKKDHHKTDHKTKEKDHHKSDHKGREQKNDPSKVKKSNKSEKSGKRGRHGNDCETPAKKRKT